MTRIAIALMAIIATTLVAAEDMPLPQFVDIARQAGVVFRHTNGASPEKHLVETMGSGGLFFDYDSDGLIDIFLVDGGSVVDPAVHKRARHRLFRNGGNGTFADVSDKSGIRHRGYGMGACAGDYDSDGDPDLYITGWGQNALYQNRGDGTFADVTAASGVGGLRSNGMGIVVADYDADGWPDVFVANDTMPNFLFRNQGKWKFAETGLVAGVAVASDGKARAGMGIDAADYDGDGQLDVAITNLDFEMHSLYRGLERGLFSDATSESAIGFPSLPFVGFGVSFLDYDNDARLDLAIATGHILDNAPQFRPGATYAQRHLLFRSVTPRRFVEVGKSAGPAFNALKVSRGLATGDIDNDGDLDLLVTTNGQDAELLRNDGGNRGRAVLIDLRGAPPNRSAIGARVRATVRLRTQTRDVRAGSSYLSQSDLRLHFGLGSATTIARLDVQWPSGKTETLRNVAADQLLTIQEGAGIVEQKPLAK